MHVCALNEQNGPASPKKYSSCVSVEDYVATSFKSTSPERQKMTLKHPVGRPRKRPMESDGQALADNRELDIIQAAPVRKRGNPSPRTTTSTPLQSLPLPNGTASRGYTPTVFFRSNPRARRRSNQSAV